jgi:hypothetical protein
MSFTINPEFLEPLEPEKGVPPTEAVAADPAKQEPDAMYTREEIEMYSLDEDPEAVASIALNLQGAGSEFVSRENLVHRSELIKRARDEVGGRTALGVMRDAYEVGSFVVDNVLAAANTIGYGLGLETAQQRGFDEVARTRSIDGVAYSEDDSLLIGPQKLFKNKKRYSNYYNKLREKEDRSPLVAGFLTALKVFEETPELRSEPEFVKEVLERFNSRGRRHLITVKEAEAMSAFSREDATTMEQIARLIPEVTGFSAASLKFLFRNSKDIIKKAEDILKKEGVDLKGASEEQLRKAVEKISADERFFMQNTLKLGGLRREAFTKRAATVLQAKRAGGLGKMPFLFFQNTAAITKAKSKLAAARTAKEQKLIDQELDNLASLRRKRLEQLPKGVTDVLGTEVAAAAMGAVAENYFGEEYAWMGAIAGGVTAGFSIDGVYRLSKTSFQGVANFVLGAGGAINLLSDAQLDSLITKGVLPRVTDLTRNQEKALNSLAQFIRSLPEEQRRIAFGQIKYFSQIKDDLLQYKNAEGKSLIDEELIDTTIGSAMGIVPLMMIRQAISDRSIDASKGIKALDDELKQIIENSGQNQKAVEQFRSLVDQLSGRADDVGYQDAKFTEFVDSMRGIAQKENESIAQEVIELEGLVNSILSTVMSPQLISNQDSLDRVTSLVAEMLSNNLVVATTRGAGAAQRQLQEEAIPQFQRQAEDLISLSEEATTEISGRIEKFVVGYLDKDQLDVDLQQAAIDLAKLGKTKLEAKKGIGRGLFNQIKGMDVEIDVTDWLKSIFRATDEGEEPIIARGKARSSLQKLSRRRISDAGTLTTFADASAKSNVEELLKTNRAFADDIREAINEINAEKGIDPVGEDYVPSFEDIRRLLQGEGEKPPNDFEVFLSLLDYPGLEDLKITMSPIEIQDLSSGFGSAAARETSRPKARIYNSLSEGIINAIDDTADYGPAREAIIRAKNYWKRNVIASSYDPENEIGAEIAKQSDISISGTGFVTNPVKWIDFDKIMQGDATYGRELIEKLNRSFGEYDEASGTWKMEEETKNKVTVLLDSLLSNHISGTDTVKAARRMRKRAEAGDKEGEFTGLVLEEPGLKETRLDIARKRIKAEYLESDALEELQKAGFINPEPVRAYNSRIDNFMAGTKELKNAEINVRQAVDDAAKQVKSQIKARQSALNEINRFNVGEEGARTVVDYDNFLSFFVDSPMGARRIEEIKQKLTAKGAKYSGKEAELDSLLSDITLESISRSSYGDFIEGAEAGIGMYNFNPSQLFELMNSPDKVSTLKMLVPDDEKFDGLQKLSQLMMIQSREAGAALQQAGLNVRVPRGLSVESMISRVYSISRGVISPKYVATEVALLNLRKARGKAFVELLNDPKMVDELVEILETEGDVSRKVNANMFTVMINALAKADVLASQDRQDRQMQELRQFRRSQ